MVHKIVLTAVEHPLWGIILQPLLTEEKNSFSLQVLEIANSKADYFPELNAAQQKIVHISEKYSDKALMKLYSKEKITSQFLKKVNENTIRNYIRPCIENYHKQIIALLPEADIPFYIREGSKTRTLYDSDEVTVCKEYAKAIFNFIKEEENGFRYFIQVRWNKDITSLKDKSYLEISSNPAIAIVDQKLFVFEDIDAKKLQPFFTKSYIGIPPASEKEYIEKFVVNCIKEYEVHSEGIPIRQTKPERTPILSLKPDHNQRPVLCLYFQYGTSCFPFHTPPLKSAYANHQEEKTEIVYFDRDPAWEKELLSLLTDNGLVVYRNTSLVMPMDEFHEQEKETYLLLDWIREHPSVLSRFSFRQEEMERVYYTGEISLNTTIDSKQDWFDLQCIVQIGEYRIPFSHFRHHILEGIREYVLPDNRIAILPKEWFSRYYEIMLFGKKTGENIRLKKHHFYLVTQLNHTATEPIPLYNPERTEPVPEELKATLRPYQQKGFSWLVHLHENHFGGCLADDMGLGKTLQTIALLQHIYKDSRPQILSGITNPNGQLTLFGEEPLPSGIKEKVNPSIIVVPTSLMHNWLNEFKKFAPALRIYLYSGTKRLKSKDIGKVFAYYHIVLTTYGILRNDIDLLKNASFHYLILDESQYVKNPASQSYKAVKQINAAHKLILTGTPIENSLSDLWAQFEIINEGVLGSLSSFKKAYINPILQKKNKEKEAVLLKMIQPFLLRRTKREVAPELPSLTEKVIYCDMSTRQKKIYLEEKNKVRNSLLSEVINPNSQVGKNTSFIALQGLTRLRLLANHPVLLDKEYEADSGKFEQIIMHFENLRAENHKVLIFSSFVKHLQLLAQYFDKQSWKYAWLTGSVHANEREQEIKKFNERKDINCFFISLKAGGVGLNLTEADYVFIIDPWWNPAAEMQAVARSHRIGQEKKVMVFRFISTATIEEKIVRLQQEKSSLAETFVTSGNFLSHITVEQLDKLLETENEAGNQEAEE
ncbi:MAG: DEAD/DEAH box helicase [Candidatus Azobacteroides sp.]|nr:DEAD/DEAH box helicase [Candidatus Azobacteroides sp.]